MLTEKDYCDYGTTVALEELGFPLEEDYGGVYIKSCGYKRPSLYEAQKFLRKEKNIIVDVRYGAQYYNVVLNHTITGGRHIVKDKNNRIADFTEYEEALSEGIKEAVKRLKEEG